MHKRTVRWAIATAAALGPAIWLACSGSISPTPTAPSSNLSASVAPIGAESKGSPGNPHWIIGNPPQTYCDAGTLTCYFKLAGLGNDETVTVTVHASVLFDYDCQNGGLNIPKAFTGVSGTATGSGTFTSDKNGSIMGSITLNASSLVSGAANCPPSPQKGLLGPWQAVNAVITNASNFGMTADGTSPSFHLTYP